MYDDSEPRMVHHVELLPDIQAVGLIAEVRSDIPLILQPVTPLGGCVPPKAETLLRMQEQALRVLRDVRLIPQAHSMMGIR